MVKSKRLHGLAMGAMMVTGALSAPALASPGNGGVIPENLVVGSLPDSAQQNSDRVKFQTKDDTAVLVQKLTFNPGGVSGWHHHPGIVIVTVKTGLVKVSHSDCSFHEYGPGSPHGSVFTEGEQRVHQASSEGGAVVYATYVAPAASPQVFRIEDDVPFCAQPQQ